MDFKVKIKSDLLIKKKKNPNGAYMGGIQYAFGAYRKEDATAVTKRVAASDILSTEDAPAGGPGPARASFNDVLELLAAASSWGIRCNLLQFQPQQVRQE